MAVSLPYIEQYMKSKVKIHISYNMKADSDILKMLFLYIYSTVAILINYVRCIDNSFFWGMRES